MSARMGGEAVDGSDTPQPELDLDLDAIETRADRTLAPWAHGGPFTDDARSAAQALAAIDVPALVAEVRRLRAQVERVEALEPDWSDIGKVVPIDVLEEALRTT